MRIGKYATEHSRRWREEHPLFAEDFRYRVFATGLDCEAVRCGIECGSPEYIDFINRHLEAEFGPDHGKKGIV